jgi:transposase
VWEVCETVCGFAKTCGRVLCVHRSGSFHTRGAANDASRVDSERMVVPTHTRISETNGGMQIKTILNRIQKHRGFVYGTVQLEEQIGGLALTVDIAPHRRNRPRCAGCEQPGAVYDRLAPRRFEFVPLWGLRVFFLYAMRRVDCSRCGVTVERVPWADGKHQLTTTYQWFLARWAKRLSWKEVARVFSTSWDQVFRSVAMAVAWGRDHVDLTGIRAIGIDEIHWQHGPNFLTLVYQIDPTRKRLLWIGQHRRAKTLLQFFRWFGTERTAALGFICSDMWKPYLQVVAKKVDHALHILDRFHIAKHMSDAIDEVRRAEVRALRAQGRQPLLTKTRWLLLKRPANQTREQRARLRDLVQHNLRAVRAMLLRELFDPFWHYRSLAWAEGWLDEWCRRVMRSRIEPMKKVARMLRDHRALLLNWFRARGEISAAVVEGFNNKAKLTARKAYGFRSYRCLEIALYHTLGQLPEPEATHRFC